MRLYFYWLLQQALPESEFVRQRVFDLVQLSWLPIQFGILATHFFAGLKLHLFSAWPALDQEWQECEQAPFAIAPSTHLHRSHQNLWVVSSASHPLAFALLLDAQLLCTSLPVCSKSIYCLVHTLRPLQRLSGRHCHLRP